MKFRKSPRFYIGLSLLAILFLITALVVLLPVGIQVTAKSWLRDKGLDADIQFVGFNLNSGIFLVENAQGRNADGKGFSLGKMIIEVNWLPLLDKQLDIQRFKIENLYLDVVTTKKGIHIAGMDFSGQPEPRREKVKQANTEPTRWTAQIQQIELANIKVCHDNPAVAKSDTLTVEQMMKACTSLGSMNWQGKIGWAAPANNQPVTTGVSITGNLLFEKLFLAANDGKQSFIHLGKLSVDNLTTTGLEIVRSDQVEMANADFFQHSSKQDAPYLASWQSLKLGKPAFDQKKQNAAIENVSLSGLKANIEITRTGLTGLPVTSSEKEPAKKQDGTEAGKAFTVSIKNITINGKSRAIIVDKAVDPVFKESLNDIRLSLSNINSAQPEIKSPLSASIKVSEYGEISIKGTVQPFTEKLTLNLEQDIKNIDLANYNVYGKTFIGHKIHSGHLELDQKININNGHLDTETTVILNKFKVESLQGKEAEKYKSDLGIPLSTALSLLRDKNDNIKLTVPVTGDMHSPDFSLNDVISTVTSKVIKEAIINYYTPFGLVKILGGIVDLAAGLSFEPVEFDVGKTNLQQQGISSLENMAKLLAERPQVQLTLCGFPAKADILASYKPEELGLKNAEEKKPLKLSDKQTGELLALFRTRMDNIKKHMVKQLKVNPGQVLLCSEPDNKDWVTGIEAKPEINISI